MKHCLSVIAAAAFLLSCGHSAHWETLAGVESYIEGRPDSALAVLERIDPRGLSGREERAKHALLLSMALDKNYIDTTGFDVLRPALDYYAAHGTATEKLRTRYYQGRIYENRGEDDKAMQCFADALSEGAGSGDIATKARILYTQGRIYSMVFEWDKCLAAYDGAGRLFLEAGKTDSYIDCLACLINVYTITGDEKQAARHVALGLEHMDGCGMRIKGYFYSNYLTFAASRKPADAGEVKSVIGTYLGLADSAHVDWFSVANAYLCIGEPDLAEDAVSHHGKTVNVQQEIRRYALLADIHRRKNEYKEAFGAYRNYVALTDSLEYAKTRTDIGIIEERHSLTLKNIEEKEKKNRLILLATAFAVAATVLFVMAGYRLKVKALESELEKQEKERYRLLYHQMEQERDRLTEILERNKDFDGAAKDALLERISLLNRFFASYIANDPAKRVRQEIERLLADKDAFMASTRLAFAGSHPGFIRHLEEKGLDEGEINYCCLYALGLTGKEIGDYIQMKSHFNNSSRIRRKLGLDEHDMNLGTYIQALLKEKEE